MDIQWFSKEDFWKQVANNTVRQTEPDGWFHFQMPLYEIRPRIPGVPPTFTPADEDDFPGPVERWYGIADGHRFMLTYEYCSPITDSVLIQHGPGAIAAAAVKSAIEAWKSRNPYQRSPVS